MRIAAIYIEDHDYLFDNPQTINFGGSYFYEFIKNGNDIFVTRRANDLYIDDLFNLTALDSKITNVNAIVGQNGSGKSSLLDIIRSAFIENTYALPLSNSLLLIEVENSDLPELLRNDFSKVYLREINDKDSSGIVLKIKSPKKTQTIYYTPHFDYKYNPKFDEVDNHDISFDKIVENDLEEISDKATNDRGWRYSPGQELLFKNSLRQIEFLSSDLVSKQNIFKDLFHLQDHYEPILIFRGYKENEKDWNTPRAFRKPLKIISEKLEQEIRDWHKIRRFEDTKVLNQAEIYQYILKRNVIKSLITLLYKQMERENSYLEEGEFPYDKLESKLLSLDGYNAFLLFIDNCKLKIRSGKTKKIFNVSNLKLLLSKIYESIELAEDEHSVSNDSIMVSKESAIEILNLQRQFLTDLNNYYYIFNSKKEATILSDRDKIEEFINYMPFSRRLSSGENALLNLFSRFYNFINSNLKLNKFRKLNDHYILLLDEADLSFHPIWKIKYIKAILKTIPYFFNELKNHPTIQIIFTTHDPLTLSDLPNSNVIYIERRTYEESSKILNYNDKNRPQKTFGANISDLIADSFFVENSLIGEFASDLIQNTIKWLNEKTNLENASYYKQIIKIIDEPIVQRKLAEMYDDKMSEKFQLRIVEDQIRKLQSLKNKLE